MKGIASFFKNYFKLQRKGLVLWAKPPKVRLIFLEYAPGPSKSLPDPNVKRNYK